MQRGPSTGLRSIWWYIWLTSRAKAAGAFLNLTKTSTMSLYNLRLASDSLFKLFLFCWAEPSKTTRSLVVAFCGLTTGKCGKNHSDGGLAYFLGLLRYILYLSSLQPLAGKPVPVSHLALTFSRLSEGRILQKKRKPWRILVVVVNDVIIQMAYSFRSFIKLVSRFFFLL